MPVTWRVARPRGRPAPACSSRTLSHRFVEDTDWEFSEFSVYDLGQAVAHMSIQAQALGLHVRQFRAFDRDGIAAEFAVPEHWEVTTLAAIGRAAPGSERASILDDTGEPPLRARRALDEILWPSYDRQLGRIETDRSLGRRDSDRGVVGGVMNA